MEHINWNVHSWEKHSPVFLICLFLYKIFTLYKSNFHCISPEITILSYSESSLKIHFFLKMLLELLWEEFWFHIIFIFSQKCVGIEACDITGNSVTLTLISVLYKWLLPWQKYVEKQFKTRRKELWFLLSWRLSIIYIHQHKVGVYLKD